MNPADCFSEIKTKSTELVLYLENLISFQNLSWQEHFGFEGSKVKSPDKTVRIIKDTKQVFL